MIEKIKESIAKNLNLNSTAIYGIEKPVSEIVALSPTAINSIDVFESFASAFAEHGVDDILNLPIFTLNDSIDNIISEIAKQLCDEVA